MKCLRNIRVNLKLVSRFWELKSKILHCIFCISHFLDLYFVRYFRILTKFLIEIGHLLWNFINNKRVLWLSSNFKSKYNINWVNRPTTETPSSDDTQSAEFIINSYYLVLIKNFCYIRWFWRAPFFVIYSCAYCL